MDGGLVGGIDIDTCIWMNRWTDKWIAKETCSKLEERREVHARRAISERI